MGATALEAYLLRVAQLDQSVTYLRPVRAARPPAAGLVEVVLADDHDLMRGRLRRVLEEDPKIRVIADTDDLGEAIRHVFRSRPRVLVLDMSMASGSSIEAIRRLRRHVPDTEVVVLKMEAS